MKADSFADFLEAWGEAYPPSMRYEGGEDFQQWQQRFRRKLSELMGPRPPRVRPEAEILDTVDQDDHVRHTLRIPVSALTTLTAYLLIPKDIGPEERRPGLIVSHGHARAGIDSVCGVDPSEEPRRAYALPAVRAGYVVLAPAWWGWHGRDGHLDLIGGRDRCNVIQMAASMYGLNVLALHIQDGQAAIDVLAERPEVDPERIGCMGNSYGGRTTMWLTIFEERIKACVPSGCMNIFRERSLKLTSCGIQFLPGLLRYGDVPELLSLIAPCPMQLQAGKQDPIVNETDREMIAATVRQAYEAADAEDRFDYALHSDEHILLWDLAEPFLARWLLEQS